jgi:putative SOS response-associated peptidase YedK
MAWRLSATSWNGATLETESNHSESNARTALQCASQHWLGGYLEEKGLDAFTLVTIEPNAFVQTFHSLMIGQLADDKLDVWLRPEEHKPAEVRSCLQAPSNEELVAIPIKHDACKAKFDDPSALAAIGNPIAWADVKDTGPGDATGGKQATLF